MKGHTGCLRPSAVGGEGRARGPCLRIQQKGKDGASHCPPQARPPLLPVQWREGLCLLLGQAGPFGAGQRVGGLPQAPSGTDSQAVSTQLCKGRGGLSFHGSC